MKKLWPIILMFAASAQAEVFSCVQADGTQVFAYVPCRVETSDANPTAESSNRQPLLEGDETRDINLVAASTPRSLAEIAAEIQDLESLLGELRLSREADIANAPFNVAEPASLTQLKRNIRARYQTEIDEHLTELLHLRQQKRQLETNQPPLGTAD